MDYTAAALGGVTILTCNVGSCAAETTTDLTTGTAVSENRSTTSLPVASSTGNQR
jgi:hypothetical protein